VCLSVFVGVWEWFCVFVSPVFVFVLFVLFACVCVCLCVFACVRVFVRICVCSCVFGIARCVSDSAVFMCPCFLCGMGL